MKKYIAPAILIDEFLLGCTMLNSSDGEVQDGEDTGAPGTGTAGGSSGKNSNQKGFGSNSIWD